MKFNIKYRFDVCTLICGVLGLYALTTVYLSSSIYKGYLFNNLAERTESPLGFMRSSDGPYELCAYYHRISTQYKPSSIYEYAALHRATWDKWWFEDEARWIVITSNNFSKLQRIFRVNMPTHSKYPLERKYVESLEKTKNRQPGATEEYCVTVRKDFELNTYWY